LLSDKALRRIKDAERFVFVTGAGISEESGIPTFRGKGGYWRKYDPMKLATIDAFYENPGLVWEWYQDRRRNILAAEPNLGHYAIADIGRYKKSTVLTQNIDGLHQRAGSRNVTELHGSIMRTKCTECNFMEDAISDYADLPPKCGCGANLRPDVVWFGEGLPQDAWQHAIAESKNCEVMVIAGTSLEVSPANTLPHHAAQSGALLIEVNPQQTVMSAMMNCIVRERSAAALPKLAEIVKT